MKRFTVLASLFIAACSGPNWTTDSPPIPVVMVKATDLDVCERAIEYAVDTWNKTAGGQLFHYTGRVGHEADYRINVSCKPEITNGKAGWTERSYRLRKLVRITVEIQELPALHGTHERVLALHEFGHAVGLEDDPDPGTAMSWAGATATITDEDAQYVRDIVSGAPQEPQTDNYDEGPRGD